jgi:oxepin-CoA hydrolase/3-oxo-5,6-dehydrosuberyl-CoA semialdehyde dehydrogenase
LTARLKSYAQGEWIEGTGQATSLIHAVTGETIAEATSEGVDFKGMLDYARTVGGPKLRKMTFHERARMLKEMAKYLMERKEGFYKLSEASGRDKNRFVDRHRRRHRGLSLRTRVAAGGISQRDFLCRRECRAAVEGFELRWATPHGSSRGSRRSHQRFQLSRVGMLEKLAPTLLAGMPAIVKPATIPSYLTEACGEGDDRVGDSSRGRAAACRRRRW